jgi:hypothetical protein
MKGLVTVDAQQRGGYDKLRPGGGLIRPRPYVHRPYNGDYGGGNRPGGDYRPSYSGRGYGSG